IQCRAPIEHFTISSRLALPLLCPVLPVQSTHRPLFQFQSQFQSISSLAAQSVLCSPSQISILSIYLFASHNIVLRPRFNPFV
ncbi:uncharacterized protein STEHIDRAFT_149172, partial [Stereum hirsutum FP-91666 SS1]|uniref:uncharacterized protein n=1 Tax=Stereum hirsutum (strain FP-91666) TaxID=721885 RepID=UPI0004449585